MLAAAGLQDRQQLHGYDVSGAHGTSRIWLLAWRLSAASGVGRCELPHPAFPSFEPGHQVVRLSPKRTVLSQRLQQLSQLHVVKHAG